MAIVGALFLIGVSSTAQAQTVEYDPDYPNKAIGIKDLIIDGRTYNVEFLERVTAINAYGPLPGDFDFDDQSSAEDAIVGRACCAQRRSAYTHACWAKGNSV
jgi:hypothetical protein